jgi:hypothetical protein
MTLASEFDPNSESKVRPNRMVAMTEKIPTSITTTRSSSRVTPRRCVFAVNIALGIPIDS